MEQLRFTLEWESKIILAIHLAVITGTGSASCEVMRGNFSLKDVV